MVLSPTMAALPPPPGVIPSLVDSNDNMRKIWLAGNIICLIIPSVLVPLRFYVKGHVMKDLRLTDCKS